MENVRVEFNSSSLPQNISVGLYQEKCYDYAAAHVDKLFNVLFFGVSEILRNNQSKEHPTSFIITDLKKNIIASATTEFYEGEGDNPGNWSLVWTFGAPKTEDPDAITIDLLNPNVHPYFRSIAGDKYGMIFHTDDTTVVLFTYIMEQLYKWLDENAKEDTIVSIDLDGVFSGKVEIKDGKKYFAICPEGEVKKGTKNDDSIDEFTAVELDQNKNVVR